MNFRPVFYTLGILLTILSIMMLLPALVDYAHNDNDWHAFTTAQITTAFVGISLILSTRENDFRLNIRQAFLMTVMGWVVLAGFAALPFCFSQMSLSYTDAYFESMSGLTTTGSTVITHLNNAPSGLLLWRQILHALGGMGVIIMAMAILPFLQVGGMQLFKSGAVEIEKIMPSAMQIGAGLVFVYMTMIFFFSTFLYIAGMTPFDALSHAVSAVSTGGFANYDLSIGHFNDNLIELILIGGMLAGSLPFILYLRALKGSWKSLFTDSQVKVFLAIVLIAIAVQTLNVMFATHQSFTSALRQSAFAMVSIITTTGFTTTDYSAWGAFGACLAVFLMVVGGCSCSTTGGIKVFRFQVLFSVATVQFKKLLEPNGVFLARFNGAVIQAPTLISIMGFFFLFFLCYAILTLAVLATGVDSTTALSGTLASITNVGPGVGAVIGPSGNYASLPDTAKWLFSLAMLVGRLEVFTVLVLLTPYFWRR